MSAVLQGKIKSDLQGEGPGVSVSAETQADAEGDSTAQEWLNQLLVLAPELQRAAVWRLFPDGATRALAALPTLGDAKWITPMPVRATPSAAVEVSQAAASTPLVLRSDGIARVDFPVFSDERGITVVCLALADLPSLDIPRLIRSLHWGAGWLLRLGDDHTTQSLRTRLDRARFVLDADAAMLDQPSPHESALALVNLLALRFDATLVQMARVEHLVAKTVARSNAAWFDARTQLVKLAEAAMNEAVDERAVVIWPARPGDPPPAQALVDYAHEEKAVGLAIVPLMHNRQVQGVLLFERNSTFKDAEIEAMEVAALSIAPIAALQWAAAESLPQRIRRSARELARRTTDSSHPGLKLAGVTLGILLLAAALIPVEQRVTARAVIEGEVQRAAVVPFAGYVQRALARAGDTVKTGQLLATLDDKDLRLEQNKLESELEVSLRKEREAMADGNRVDMRLASAQAGQTRAQLDLVLEKLQRVQIAAPYDGVIVKGDLSQQIGSPVELGKVLFEIAPLDAWRVVIEVDERDVSLVSVGQAGQIALTSLPGQRFDFTVRRITAVSTPQDGRNFFRVEAQIARPDPRLRPGLEGVAKVHVADDAALGVWTRSFRHWLRVTLWEYMP